MRQSLRCSAGLHPRKCVLHLRECLNLVLEQDAHIVALLELGVLIHDHLELDEEARSEVIGAHLWAEDRGVIPITLDGMQPESERIRKVPGPRAFVRIIGCTAHHVERRRRVVRLRDVAHHLEEG